MSDTFNAQTGDCLLIVDVQNDFCAGGKLAVPDGESVVPVINALIPTFACVVLTQDWHPAKHSSFASEHPGHDAFSAIEMSYGQQTLWPDHCIQGSTGAELHTDLHIDASQLIIRKGFRRAIDSYSAFQENDHQTTTGLAGYLRERAVKRVVCVGLALDFCVGFSAEDARQAGFDVVLLESACRAIDLDGSLDAMRQRLDQCGVQRVRETDL